MNFVVSTFEYNRCLSSLSVTALVQPKNKKKKSIIKKEKKKKNLPISSGRCVRRFSPSPR